MKPKTNPSTSSAGNFPREQIAQLAHTLWLEEGKPEGRELQHWLEAERQLRAGGSGMPRERDTKSQNAVVSRQEIEADKRVDGLSPPSRDPRTPKGERL